MIKKVYVIDDFSDPNDITKITDEKILNYLRKVSTIPTADSNMSFEEYVRIISEEFDPNSDQNIEKE